MANLSVLITFLFAGLLAGGAVSASRAGAKAWTIIAAVAAVSVIVLAIWMMTMQMP